MKRKPIIVAIFVTAFLLSATSSFATNGYQLIGIGSYQKSPSGP